MKRTVKRTTKKATPAKASVSKSVKSAQKSAKKSATKVVETPVESIKIVKDDKAEVAKGFECGIKLQDGNLVKEGDTLEFYINEPIKK